MRLRPETSPEVEEARNAENKKTHETPEETFNEEIPSIEEQMHSIEEK
jgi:hypothetical protein